MRAHPPQTRFPWLLLALALPLQAQAPADRAAILAFSDTLARASAVEQVRTLESQRTPGTVGLIRASLAALRRGELGDERGPYDQALQLIERAIDAEGKWPLAWYGLGLVHIASYRRGFVAKASNYTPAGASYREAAMRSFARSIEVDSTFVPSANALAGIALSLGHRLLPKLLDDPLRRVELVPGIAPEVRLAASNVAFGRKEYPRTLEILSDYLRLGGDSGVARVEQARTLSALGRKDEAVGAYLAGLAGVTETGRLAYRDDLTWTAGEDELLALDSLPAAGVPEFVRRFWRERDALEARGANERLAEHLRRWVYAHEHFLAHRADDVPANAEGFGDQDQAGLFEVGAIAEVMVEVAGGIPAFKTYRRTQWELDDRGVVYIRHGEPVKRVSSVAGPPNESWAYDVPEGRRVYHFISSRALGTQSATTLTASLPLDPDMLDARADLDSRYAQLADRIQRLSAEARTRQQHNARIAQQASLTAATPGMGRSEVTSVAGTLRGLDNQPTSRLGADVLWREAVRNRAAIAGAVTSDGFPLHFKRSLDAIVQIHGVGFSAGESKRILVVFAVPGPQLVPQPRPDGGPGILYPISFRIIALDRASGLVRQLDTTRTFLAQDTLRGEQHLTGVLELRVPAGSYRVRTLVTQPGSESGTGVGRDSVSLPGAPRDLVLSDLILGQSQAGLAWKYGAEQVALNPLNAFPRGQNAELTYEVGGLQDGRAYTVVTSIRKGEDKPDARPQLQVGFEFTPAQGYELVRRELGLANLKPGTYLLTVTVREQGSDREVHRTRALNILAK